MKKALILVLILTLGYGGIYFLSQYMEKIRPTADETWSDEDLSFSGRQLGLIGHDFRGLMADWYWINSLQYIGYKLSKVEGDINVNDLRPLNPRLLYPMLDSASTLDPQFMTIYSYGAAVLPAIDKNQAVKLLEKGIVANPEDWRLYHNLGYIYWEMKNYEKAAEVYSQGSQKENAPVWMKQMSVNMQAQGSSREFALKIYEQMYDSAEDEQTKVFALIRFQQVQAFDELDIANRLLEEQKNRNGRCVNSLKEIYPSLLKTKTLSGNGFLIDGDGNLSDPLGTPYVFDVEKCKVFINPESKIPQS